MAMPYTTPSLEHIFDLRTPLVFSEIEKQIHPTIVYALLLEDSNGFKKNEYVKVLEDVGNGGQYKITNGDLTTWVYAHSIQIIPPEPICPVPLAPAELEFYITTLGCQSTTPYYVWVDLSRQIINVFHQDLATWTLLRQIPCATGKPTTPTVRGTFTVCARGELLRSAEMAKYWVKFYNNYLFHSCPINAQNETTDSRLGTPISNGCIRMLESDARWFYETIPNDTTIWIY